MPESGGRFFVDLRSEHRAQATHLFENSSLFRNAF
jgi:hypothetical protein